MAFRAQRDGICIKCGMGIKGGVDYISWRRTKNGPASGEAWHFPACSTASDNTPAIKTENAPKIEANGEPDIHKALEILLAAVNKKENSSEKGITREEVQEIVTLSLSEREREIPTVESIDAKIGAALKDAPFLDEQAVLSKVKEEISKRLTRTLVIEKDDREYKKFALSHEDLPTLIKLANTRGPAGHRLNLYMHGPAGSGKSTAARQVAEALGLRFGYSSLNPMTPDSRALGFIHAGGDYVSTEFFKCYTKGGVFCFDEIDNASASFVTTLNSALENGHGAFPHGVYKRHPDFLCVCTANTIGRGGDIHYPERRALDSAFLERFVFVEWAYDDKLTRAIVGGILGEEADALMSWVDLRANDLRNRFPELVISPRAYIQSALLTAHGFDKKLIESAAISRGLKNA